MKKLFIVSLVGLLILSSVGCGKKAEVWDSYELSSITSSPFKINMPVNDVSSNITVSAVHTQVGSSSGSSKIVTKNITFQSSRPEVATVDTAGKVTGISAGTANITISYREGNITKSTMIPVTITPPKVT